MFIRFLFIIALVTFLSAANARAAMRIWTSSNGKSLEAEYVKVSLNKVVLRKPNGQTVSIPLSYLSEADQNHVSELSQPKAKSGSTLSESEITTIVEKYEAVSKKLNPKDGIPSVLFSDHLSPEQQQGVVELFGKKERPGSYRHPMEGCVVDHVRFKKANYPYVFVRIEYKPTSTRFRARPDTNSWIYLLENGTIKYDPLFYPHPVEIAFNRIGIILEAERYFAAGHVENSQDNWDESLEVLIANRIPTFGLSKTQSATERKGSLKKLIEWLRNDATEWDLGDPKIHIHEDAYEERLDDFEKMNKDQLPNFE